MLCYLSSQDNNLKRKAFLVMSVKANACASVYFGVVLAKKGYVDQSTLVRGRCFTVRVQRISTKVHLVVHLSGCF